jgi:hypothetical protein
LPASHRALALALLLLDELPEDDALAVADARHPLKLLLTEAVMLALALGIADELVVVSPLADVEDTAETEDGADASADGLLLPLPLLLGDAEAEELGTLHEGVADEVSLLTALDETEAEA